ncbi:MAG: hypothetical protein WAT58_10015 [Candidatus Dormiibacterota bacterium]
MRRFGVRGDPEEEAIRLYNRVRRGGRWPEGYWERPGRIRASWAVLDYWLRRIRGTEDTSAYRQLGDAEVVKQGLERPVQVMEDLYGQHWRDLVSIVDEVRTGMSPDDPWSENAVLESFNKVYAKVFADSDTSSPHYQSLRRGITRGVRALEAEYAAEEAEREQRFQEFWSERYLTREFRTPYSEAWTVWSTDNGERYSDAVLQILEKEAVITLILRDEDDLLPIIDALERDFPVDKPARYVCWTLKDGFRGVLYYCEECGGLHAEESDEHVPQMGLDEDDDRDS